MSSSAHDTSYPFCAGKHPLAERQKVNSQSHENEIEFLRENGLCVGCLRAGHLSRNCKRRMTGQSCQARQPTILHIKAGVGRNLGKKGAEVKNTCSSCHSFRPKPLPSDNHGHMYEYLILLHCRASNPNLKLTGR